LGGATAINDSGSHKSSVRLTHALIDFTSDDKKENQEKNFGHVHATQKYFEMKN
jgi:hypothetical protein